MTSYPHILGSLSILGFAMFAPLEVAFTFVVMSIFGNWRDQNTKILKIHTAYLSPMKQTPKGRDQSIQMHKRWHGVVEIDLMHDDVTQPGRQYGSCSHYTMVMTTESEDDLQ